MRLFQNQDLNEVLGKNLIENQKSHQKSRSWACARPHRDSHSDSQWGFFLVDFGTISLRFSKRKKFLCKGRSFASKSIRHSLPLHHRDSQTPWENILPNDMHVSMWVWTVHWFRSLFGVVQLLICRSLLVNTRGVLRAPWGRHSGCKQSTHILNTSQPPREMISPWCDFLGTSAWTTTCGQCAHRIPSIRMWTGNASALDGEPFTQVRGISIRPEIEQNSPPQPRLYRMKGRWFLQITDSPQRPEFHGC